MYLSMVNLELTPLFSMHEKERSYNLGTPADTCMLLTVQSSQNKFCFLSTLGVPNYKTPDSLLSESEDGQDYILMMDE